MSAAGKLAILLALSTACLQSCTATRTVSPTSAAGVQRIAIQPGDVVRLMDKYRQQYTVRVAGLDSTTLTGDVLRPVPKAKRRKQEFEPTGQTVQMRYADIALVETRQRSALKTAGAVLLVLEVAGAVVLGVSGYPLGMSPP